MKKSSKIINCLSVHDYVLKLWLFFVEFPIIIILLLFIHSFIHSKIYIAPLQGNYSEALPTPVRTKK